MNISTAKGAQFDYDRQALLAGQMLVGPIGSSTPTAAQSTVAGLFAQSSSPAFRSRIRKAHIRTTTVMDVAMGYTAFNYVSTTAAAINELYTGGTFAAAPFAGANAAPNVNVMKIFPSVPLTGIDITDINVLIPQGTYFVFYGLTVNVGLYGYIWWQEAVTF